LPCPHTLSVVAVTAQRSVAAAPDAAARNGRLEFLDALRGIAGDEPGVDRVYERRTELARVLSALRGLPRLDREVLLLRIVGELDFPDIAVLTHSSPAAVKMRISRARRRLVALLPEYLHGRRTNTA